MAGLRERLAARVADMWLLPRMRQHVRSQEAGPRERLPARLADMWLLPRMCPHVHSQVAGRRERIAARLTDMRLLPRMRAHVNSQMVGPRERLAARLTLDAARLRCSAPGASAVRPSAARRMMQRCAAAGCRSLPVFIHS